MTNKSGSQAVFTAVDKQLFFSRNDPLDRRLGDLVRALPQFSQAGELRAFMQVAQATPASSRNFVLAGYPDDEGILLNGGRPGAQAAPTEIRRALYKMTPALLLDREPATLWDLGDLRIEGKVTDDTKGVVSVAEQIFTRHQTVAAFAEAALEAEVGWIGLGGGHDYGFADASAFCEWCRKKGVLKPLVINFDAHLDVRPLNGKPSSGTPFFRMLETYPEVEFMEVGIQGHCNSRAHLEWVRSRGAKVLTQEEVELAHEPMVTAVTRLLGDSLLRPRPVFLSIDIDGFSSAVAPGCSQSWATGFTPSEFFPVLNLLIKRLDVRMLGIYEVSPPLDHDSRTAKLAAQIIHRVLSA